MCVGLTQCTAKQSDGNGEISCSGNPCPKKWVPYFASSFSGGCVTTEDSVKTDEGTQRTDLGELTEIECAQKCAQSLDCMAIEMMDRSDPINRPLTSRCTLIKKCLRQDSQSQTLTCRPIFDTHCPDGYIRREGWQQPHFMGDYQFDMRMYDLVKEMTRKNADFRVSDKRLKLLQQIRENGNARFSSESKYSAFTIEDCKAKCENADRCTAF
jgi:hypothetical protein